eukprot:Awhi_evm1s13655
MLSLKWNPVDTKGFKLFYEDNSFIPPEFQPKKDEERIKGTAIDIQRIVVFTRLYVRITCDTSEIRSKIVVEPVYMEEDIENELLVNKRKADIDE